MKQFYKSLFTIGITLITVSIIGIYVTYRFDYINKQEFDTAHEQLKAEIDCAKQNQLNILIKLDTIKT